MPFSVDQFFDVFRRYNEAVWPAQWILYGIGWLVVALALLGHRGKSRWIPALLAMLWAWMAVAYHWAHFSQVNPAAFVFAILFLAQGMLLLAWGVSGRPLGVAIRADARGIAALAMLLYALVAYPLLNKWLGHTYPASPTFGVPCPTTIHTLAILTAARDRRAWPLTIVPLLWSVVGGSAAFLLAVPQDLGLIASGLTLLVLLLLGRTRRQLH